MFRLSHATLVTIAGTVWLLVGAALLTVGLNLIVAAVDGPANLGEVQNYPLLGSLGSRIGSFDSAALVLICLGLGIGYFKGRFVLLKSVKRFVGRIQQFPNPTSLANIYSAPYYLLIGLMIALGVTMRTLGVAGDIRGLVDIAVGAALINGAMIYYRYASAMRQQS